MSLQEAFLNAKLVPFDEKEIDRLQKEFNNLYNKYIGIGFHCEYENYPQIVKQAWDKLQKAKGTEN